MWRLPFPKNSPGLTHTFPVDDVSPTFKRVDTESLGEFLDDRFKRKVFALSDPTRPVIETALSSYKCHPLIAAVHTAFAKHYPLTLSPDSIWLVISQGFSHHIAENAEKFRGRLVRHEGRKVLTASVADLNRSSFEAAIRDFSTQIRDASDPVLHETLLCNFSTTTPAVRTASEVVLMDAYASYFGFIMSCVCGIPQITLTGSPEDWERIRARVEVLATFELGWWVARLRPILDELVKTAKGKPNRKFWQAIYKPKHAYAVECATGWIADLFPYLGDAPGRYKSNVFDSPRVNWALPVTKGEKSPRFDEDAYLGVSTSDFPSGLSSVPLKLTMPDHSTLEADLVAGYLAVEQDAVTYSLSPMIDWCVTEKAPADPVWVR